MDSIQGPSSALPPQNTSRSKNQFNSMSVIRGNSANKQSSPNNTTTSHTKSISNRTLQSPEKIINDAKNEIYNAINAFVNGSNDNYQDTFNAIQDILTQSKTQLTSKSLFGKANVNESAMDAIADFLITTIEKKHKDITFQKMKGLFEIQKQLAEEGLLAIGRSPEYKHAQKLIHSLDHNIKLINQLLSKQIDPVPLDEIIQQFNYNCEDLKIYLKGN